MSNTGWSLFLLLPVLVVFHKMWRWFVVRKNMSPFARGPYDCLLGGEAYTAGCMSILRALFCSFSSKPFSKQWSEEFHYHFLNKLSWVPLSDLLHVCTVQSPNTWYQDSVPANNLTLWALPSSTPPCFRRRPRYVHTKGYLSYNIWKTNKQTNKHQADVCLYGLPVCHSSHHFSNVSGCDSWCIAGVALHLHSINKGRQQVAMFI